MKKQLEARIVIRRGLRSDAKAIIDVFDVAANKLNQLNIPAGPMQDDIDREVRKLKVSLEKAGHQVSVIER